MGAGRGLGTASNIELAVNVAEVDLDGACGDDELLRDFLIGHSRGDESQHFVFSGSKGFGEMLCPLDELLLSRLGRFRFAQEPVYGSHHRGYLAGRQ